MKNEDKTKEKLIDELKVIRRRITESKESETRCIQAEKELRETRDYLENLLNYANAPIIVWNPELRITRFNRAFERLTGKSADEVLGSQIDILFPEDRLKEAMAHIRLTMTGERWETVEIPILRKDRTVRTVLWNSATIYAADGAAVVAAIAQGQDITERKHVEEERSKLILKLQDALAEVHKLSGLLPICANCKKIRDDKGYWHQVEEYIRSHSEVEFSHSLCPDCAEELYKELSENDSNDK